MSKKYTTNFLEDTNGSTGSANQVLISTPSGIDWVDGSGSSIIGGPYLPLSAGSSYPLTDTLYGTKATFGDTNIDVATVTIEGGLAGILDIWRNGTNANYQAIRFRDDTNANTEASIGWGSNQLRLNGTSTIVATTGGTERIRIDSSGNVGIGTTAPVKKLHVNSGSTNEVARFESTDGGAYLSIMDSNTTNSLQGIGSSGDQLTFYSNNAERMRINSSGNVGIGTTSPGERLTVNSNGSTNSVLKIKALDNRGASRYALQIDDNDTNSRGSLYIDTLTGPSIITTGNVGIGTTSPDVRLEVVEASPTNGIVADFVNSTNAGGTIAAIKLSNADSEACDVVLGANRVGANFGSDFFISPSDGVDGTNQERLRITEAGAIKFNAYNSTNNTGTPTYLLGTDALGNVVKTNTVPGSGAGPYLPLAGGTMTGDLLMDGKAGVGNVIGLASGTLSDAMSLKLYTYNNIDPGGGLGTSTGNMIQADLGSNLVLRQTANDGDITFQSDDGAGGIATYLTLDGSSTNAYFSNPGNVGIGTTSPSVTLHVNGWTRVNGGLQLDGSNRQVMAIDNTSLLLGTNNTERMRITDSGNVGIGDTGPSVKLQVSTDSPTNNVAVSIGDGWVGDSDYHKEGGLLLISGTSQDTTQTGAGIAFQTRNTANTNYWKSSMIMDRDGAIRFTLGGAGTVAGSEDFTILSGGNVGIGTTSPQKKLHVSTSDQSTARIRLSNTSASGGDNIELVAGVHNVTQDGFSIYNASGGGTQFVIQGGGNVGIGETNPAQKLHVIGNSEITGDIYLGRYIFHNDDTNTWLGFPLADTISFRTNGSDRMYINSSGNVGIGTTSPSSKLQVNGDLTVGDDSTVGSFINVIAAGTSQDAGIRFGSESNTDSKAAIYTNTSNSDLHFDVTETTRMLIDNATGNVGIGTTSPSYKLDVNGSIASSVSSGFPELRLSDAVSDFLITTNSLGDGIIKTEGTSKNIRFFNNSGETMRISGVGNVGIGVTDPSTKLEVVDTFSVQRTSTDSEGFYVTVSGADANGIVETFYQEDSASRYGIRKRYDGSTNLYQEFIHDNSTTGTEVYRVDRGTKNTSIANGNVGIGTTDPSTKLDVVASTTGKTWADYAGTVGTFERNGDSNINIVSSNTGVGGVWFGDTDSMVRGRIRYEHASDKMELWTNNSEKVSITSAGDVGIGATNPSEKLEVNGTVKATATTDAYKGYIKQNVVSYGFERGESINYLFFPYNTTAVVNTPQAYNRMVATYSGRVKKVYIKHSGGSTPTATVVNFKKHTNGTTSSTVYAATVANGASFGMSAYYEFANSDFTFNAGDLIGLLYQTTDAFGTALKTMGGVAVTITLEYNIT